LAIGLLVGLERERKPSAKAGLARPCWLEARSEQFSRLERPHPLGGTAEANPAALEGIRAVGGAPKPSGRKALGIDATAASVRLSFLLLMRMVRHFALAARHVRATVRHRFARVGRCRRMRVVGHFALTARHVGAAMRHRLA